MKILVIDDEPDVAALVAIGITQVRPSHIVVQCTSGMRALGAIAAERPDAVLLDLSMPERDGFSILNELRDRGNDVPVIVLTAKGLDTDKVRGLELGADDYITKPFSHNELLARLDAVMRRYRHGMSGRRAPPFTLGSFRIDYARRRVTVDEREIALTPTEYNLLYQLVTNAGRVMTHQTLLAQVWGNEYRDEVHYLKVYVGRIRNKLEPDPQRPRFLLTVRGVGYRFASPADLPESVG